MDEQKMLKAFDYAMRHTKILVEPRQTLFTFAPTDIHYYLLTALSEGIIELREGKLIVERPAIITPSRIFEQYFQGFDVDQREYLETMLQTGGLKGLHYKYNNESQSVHLLSSKLETVAERLRQEALARPLLRRAVIQSVPEMWSLSLMKYAMDLTIKSFPGNIKELGERGLD